MKTRGFTLIELLGVIMILGVLVLILFPSLLKQISNAKKGINDANDMLIIDAAKDYVEDNGENYKKTYGVTYCINIDTLIENNYLNPKLKDENLNDINQTKIVKLVYNTNFDYEIVNECTESGGKAKGEE